MPSPHRRQTSLRPLPSIPASPPILEIDPAVSQAMVALSYSLNAYWRVHETTYPVPPSKETEKCNEDTPEVSERLRELLQRARETNQTIERRVPLEEFLAGLRQERKAVKEKQDQQMKVSLHAERQRFSNRC